MFLRVRFNLTTALSIWFIYFQYLKVNIANAMCDITISDCSDPGPRTDPLIQL